MPHFIDAMTDFCNALSTQAEAEQKTNFEKTVRDAFMGLLIRNVVDSDVKAVALLVIIDYRRLHACRFEAVYLPDNPRTALTQAKQQGLEVVVALNLDVPFDDQWPDQLPWTINSAEDLRSTPVNSFPPLEELQKPNSAELVQFSAFRR